MALHITFTGSYLLFKILIFPIFRGDWFGGKIVGMVELDVDGLSAAFYITHVNFWVFKITTILVFSCMPNTIAKMTSICLTESLKPLNLRNLSGTHREPLILLYWPVILTLSPKTWVIVWFKNSETFKMHGTTDQTWNFVTVWLVIVPTIVTQHPAYWRLHRTANDLITLCIKAESVNCNLDLLIYLKFLECLKIVECTTCFNVIPESRGRNYSDHVGVRALFEIQRGNKI